MKIAIFPGSFDPITKGHIDIIEKSSKIFDKVIVGVSYNINKKEFLTLETRKALIIKSLAEYENIEVKSYTGLTVDFAKQCDACAIIRGLRNTVDFEYENQIANINNSLNNEIHTVFFLTKPEYNFISSSAVKEIIKNNGNISDFVPNAVYEYLKLHYPLK